MRPYCSHLSSATAQAPERNRPCGSALGITLPCMTAIDCALMQGVSWHNQRSERFQTETFSKLACRMRTNTMLLIDPCYVTSHAFVGHVEGNHSNRSAAQPQNVFPSVYPAALGHQICDRVILCHSNTSNNVLVAYSRRSVSASTIQELAAAASRGRGDGGKAVILMARMRQSALQEAGPFFIQSVWREYHLTSIWVGVSVCVCACPGGKGGGGVQKLGWPRKINFSIASGQTLYASGVSGGNASWRPSVTARITAVGRILAQGVSPVYISQRSTPKE